jgi:hypothetical protein
VIRFAFFRANAASQFLIMLAFRFTLLDPRPAMATESKNESRAALTPN